MNSEPPPEMRNWRTRLFTRLVHGYFALTRGMTLGVRAACFDAEGRIFLVKHSYVAGWHMPGGGLERGETALQALAKELREEGNLVLSETPVLFHVYFNIRTSKRDHVLFYRCDNVRQTSPKLPDREIIETGFFPLESLPPGTTSATHRRLADLSASTPPADVW
ncbi:NUDIX domain-containing protein [Pararhizobium antarcticum]|uniref:DNA mismatch repair protein MutT n=1 Tax=Pararhizobium antarcticum TaxID=1798805 RepID=A0A657LTU4_9HYPH|nr:NUDIX domain-containing protein [Pararhizobium antarcticum]OJF96835.1 DNA mismatch repair protein MutT [Pararhizobium antarcticum]OJF99009.1 DNA mismatch repair protein MutT [Rhizobium sp. 58]